MANRDIAGLLTGISSTQKPNPNMSSDQWRMAFGARQGQNLQSAFGRTTPEQEMANLDLGTVKGLKKLAELQQLRNNPVAAAKTVSQLQALQKKATDKDQELKIRTALAKALVDEGAAEQANLVANNVMTVAQGQQLLITLKGEERREVAAIGRTATAKTASEVKDSKKNIEKKTITLNNQKLVLESLGLKDSPLWDRVVSADTGNLTSTDFNTLVRTEKERRDNPVKITGELTRYVVNGREVWAGKTEIGDETPQMMYATTDANNKLIYLPLPADSKKPEDKTRAKGVTFTQADVNSAVDSLQFSGKDSKEGIENNETWDELDPDVKHKISIDVAQRTSDLVAKGTKESKAREQAIKEIYTNNLKAVEGSFYGWNNAEYIAPAEEDNTGNSSTPPEGFKEMIDANGNRAYVNEATGEVREI